MKKRILVLFVVLITLALCVSLFACDKNKDEKKNDKEKGEIVNVDTKKETNDKKTLLSKSLKKIDKTLIDIVEVNKVYKLNVVNKIKGINYSKDKLDLLDEAENFETYKNMKNIKFVYSKKNENGLTVKQNYIRHFSLIDNKIICEDGYFKKDAYNQGYLKEASVFDHASYSLSIWDSITTTIAGFKGVVQSNDTCIFFSDNDNLLEAFFEASFANFLFDDGYSKYIKTFSVEQGNLGIKFRFYSVTMDEILKEYSPDRVNELSILSYDVISDSEVESFCATIQEKIKTADLNVKYNFKDREIYKKLINCSDDKEYKIELKIIVPKDPYDENIGGYNDDYLCMIENNAEYKQILIENNSTKYGYRYNHKDKNLYHMKYEKNAWQIGELADRDKLKIDSLMQLIMLGQEITFTKDVDLRMFKFDMKKFKKENSVKYEEYEKLIKMVAYLIFGENNYDTSEIKYLSYFDYNKGELAFAIFDSMLQNTRDRMKIAFEISMIK